MGTAATQEVTGTMEQIFSANQGADLTVIGCGWTAETAAAKGTDAIVAGEVAADSYWIATQDGRGFKAEWAADAGDDSGDAVYYERWSAEGGYRHGWIDAKSRKIVQTG